MILEITGLERGTITSKAGKALTGLTIMGIKIDREGNAGEEYEKFLMDWKNTDEIAVLEEAGIGATVNMKSVKDGNFWNLDSVEIMEEGTGEPSSKTASKQAANTKAATQTPDGPADAQRESKTLGERMAGPAAEVVTLAASDEALRVEALKAALSLTGSILSSDPRFKGLLPATKTNVEIVSQMTLENASKFEAFITGKAAVNSDVTSDDADLDKDGVDAEEPTMPGDED